MRRVIVIGSGVCHCLLWVYPVIASAALTVIYDSGNTQPIAPFLEALRSGR